MAEKPKLNSVKDVPEHELWIDDIWRQAVRNKMRELGVKQHELGSHIDAGQSLISQTLSMTKGRTRSSIVERVSVALGVRMPALARVERAFIDKKDSESAEDLAQLVELFIKNNP